MIHQGDAVEVLRTLCDQSARCCVTSPPYWGLRDYGAEGQIGLEETPEEYVNKLVDVFREVRRVLADDGTLWMNLGDSYASGGRGGGGNKQATNVGSLLGPKKAPPGLKPKDLVGIPWRVAFALQADGWYLRSDIIWAKPNPMPESVRDRPTRAHEYLFLLSKSERYFYDADAIAEEAVDSHYAGNGFARPERIGSKGRGDPTPWRRNGSGRRNSRTVWTITTRHFHEAHFAVFPPEIPERCIKAGSEKGDMILDPFCGAGTTGLVADRLGRKFVGIELNPEYVKMARRRIEEDAPLFNRTGVTRDHAVVGSE